MSEPASSTSRDACRWCGRKLDINWPGFYCSKKCRQSAFRLRKRREVLSRPPVVEQLGLFAYADPPYVGLAKRYYGDQETYAGEVDHVELIGRLQARLIAGEIKGWALSCSTKSLRFLLPLCPEGVRVATWVKPGGVPPSTLGIHSKQEHVLVVEGRKAQPGVRDWLMAHPARGGGDLPGRKPIAFCAWLFDLLGMVPGDELDDLFPGTGVVGRSWTMLSKSARRPEDPRQRPVFASLVDAESVAEDASPTQSGGGASLEAMGGAASLLEARRRDEAG